MVHPSIAFVEIGRATATIVSAARHDELDADNRLMVAQFQFLLVFVV